MPVACGDTNPPARLLPGSVFVTPVMVASAASHFFYGFIGQLHVGVPYGMENRACVVIDEVRE